MQTARITVDNSAAKGNSLEVFVNTGNASDAPIVCLADNNGFPPVQDVYARPRVFQGMNGVHVTVRFVGAASGVGLAFNISQPIMSGNKIVVPLV